jgi:hypothetical protein
VGLEGYRFGGGTLDEVYGLEFGEFMADVFIGEFIFVY